MFSFHQSSLFSRKGTGETTPLNGGSNINFGTGIPTNERSRLLSNLLSRQNLENSGAVVKRRFVELSESVITGDCSIRLLALFGGIALIFVSAFDFVSKLITLRLTAILEVYTFFLGILMILLESRQLNIPGNWEEIVYKYALFLRYVWGRGILYFVAGSLQMADDGIFGFRLVGSFVMFIGVLYILVGREAARRLSLLRKSINSKITLHSKFNEAVSAHPGGGFNLEAFRTLTESTGLKLKKRDQEAMFICLDKCGRGEVSYQEFQGWWSGWDDATRIV